MKNILLFLALILGTSAIVAAYNANAQLVDVRVDGAKSRSIGVVPRRVGTDVYRVPANWKPGSLAVYRDGLRCLEDRDYHIYRGEIVFKPGTTSTFTTVQVDYEAR